MRANDLLQGLPGEELVVEGILDLTGGRRTVAACLAAIAWPRLRRAGVLPVEVPALPAEGERELYRLLRQEGGDAYGRYNALIRRLVSFERALDQRLMAVERTGE